MAPWRWPGQYEDVETTTYYRRFRHDDPHAGSYVRTDPLGLGGGTRLFGYPNDPARTCDPLGFVVESQRGERFSTSGEIRLASKTASR